MVSESQNNRDGITLKCFHSLLVYDVFKLFDSIVECDLI